MTAPRPLAGYVCMARAFKPGDPEPDGYMDRVEWHRAQQRAGMRQGQCPGCSLWLYPFQPHDCAARAKAAGGEK